METLWRSRSDESFEAEKLGGSDCPPLIQKLLWSRGLRDPETIERWFSPKLNELGDPFTIGGIQEAVKRLTRAYRAQEKICIYADFDLDVTSGLALLNDGLRQLGYKNLVLAQPKRLSEGYGFHTHIVEQLQSQGVSLIVTVDVGITAFAASERAKELGVDVIITDHHQPADRLPSAFQVINPNLKEDSSGLGYLCGAGVAFYLLRALKRALYDEGLISKETLDLRSVLDCFCIATLTDMVPLIGDNRALVKQGLLQLEKTARPGLRALLEALDLSGRTLSSQDVAIRFAPKLNALSRMELGILPIDLYLVETMAEAREMVKSVLKNNSTRIELQGAGENEAFDMLKSWTHENFVFLSSAIFHKGVVGLIATKISLQTNLPTFMAAVNSEGVLTGSGRLPAGSSDSLLSALESGREHLSRFGGHDAAAGFELHAENQGPLIEALAQHYQQTKQGRRQKLIEYDLEMGLEDVTESLMKWIEALGPFGQSFNNPIFCFRNVKLSNVVDLRGGHLKLKLTGLQSQKKMEALYFSPPPSMKEELSHVQGEIDLLGEIQWNYFAGRKGIQILVKELKLSR